MNIQDIYENEMILEAMKKKETKCLSRLRNTILSLWHLASPFSGLIRR